MGFGVSGSLWDLAGNLIQNTFQRVLQITEADNVLRDGTGSLVTSLKVSGSVTATSFVGDGSGLTGITVGGVNTSSFATTGSNIFIGDQIISGSLVVSGTISGDGSGLTGITAEWDGTHDGNAEITGGLIVTGGITGSLQGTSSWAENAVTSSYVLAAETAKLLSAGVTVNDVFIDNADGSITLPTASVALYDNTDYLGGLNEYTVSGGTTGIDFTALTDNDTNYVVIDYNSGAPVYDVLSSYSSVNEATIIPYLTIYRAGNLLNILEFGELGAGLSNKIHRRFIATEPIIRESGLILSTISGSGTATVGDDIDISSGIVWNGANQITVGSADTSDPGTILFFCWESGSAGNWNIEANYPGGFINTSYANLTTYTTESLSNNDYNINWVYRGIESEEHIYIVLGGGQFTSVAKATDEAAPTTLPEIITSHAILVGRIIGQEGTSLAQRIDSAFDITLAPAGPIQVHNELSGIDGNGTYHLSLSERDTLVTMSSSYAATGFLSSSAQIATEISGAFTAPSNSIATDINNLQVDSASFGTRITANEISASDAVYKSLGDDVEQVIQGSLRLSGDIIAENYIISSSVSYLTQSFSSGSTIFGDTLDDTHQFTGSVSITGSLTSDLVGTSSWAENVNYSSISGAPIMKSGIEAGATFSGNPKSKTITFATPFPSNLYSITITGEANRSYTVESKVSGSFIINTNANAPLTGDNIFWQAISVGEFG